MKKYNSDIAFTDTVKKIQQQKGSRDSYQKLKQRNDWKDSIDETLANFIAERDSFYMATTNTDGYPYIQHRGGPKGFLHTIDDKTLGFVDFKGNRQYISIGNLQDNNKVCLFLMDYPNRSRVKIWGTAEVIEEDQALIEQLSVNTYQAVAERVIIIHIETWDSNCRQHIVPRYTEEEIEDIDGSDCCELKID